MTASCTDSAVSQQGRGTDRAFLSVDDKALHALDNLGKTTANREVLLSGALARATVPELKAAMLAQVTRLHSLGAWRVAAELTKRGIAPCFRGLPVEGDSWWPNNVEADFILLACDLQWIAARYPSHKTKWPNLQAAFDPDKFLKTAQYLHYNGERSPGQSAAIFGLSGAQMRECAYLQTTYLKIWRGRLLRRWSDAKTKIVEGVHSKPWKSKLPKEATIERRGNLWLCAELGNWKPQRTADFYKMLTGESLPRNVVARQLQELQK